MLIALFAPLALTQAAPLAALPLSPADDRLRLCLIEVRSDPEAAIASASAWLDGLAGTARGAPQQCLGFAYMSLSRWEAAAGAFVAARDARLVDDKVGRARLGAMAGNAALAGARGEAALVLFTQAQADAAAASDEEMAGSIAADRARALVSLERNLDAAQALASARELTQQNATVWLLSATLARRMEDLESARGWIAIAAALDPINPAVRLEAGVIAVLGGSDDAAISSFQSVIDTEPQSPEAATARIYLGQLTGPALAEEPTE